MAATAPLFLFRDKIEIQPPEEYYTLRAADKDDVNIYSHVPSAEFISCPEDIWAPKMLEEIDDGAAVVRVKTRTEIMLQRLRVSTIFVLDHNLTLFFVFLMTFWALFADDLALGIPLAKDVDVPFAWVTLVFFIVFCLEQVARSIVLYEEYFLSFFWWMELVANASMVMSLGPILLEESYKTCDGAFDLNNFSGLAAGSRLARVMRLLRVLRVLRVFNSCSKRTEKGKAAEKKQSLIGKALNDKLVRSMILIVVALQVIFPLLSFDETDSSLELAFKMVIQGTNLSSASGESYGDLLIEKYKYEGEYAFNGDTGVYEKSYSTLVKTVMNGASVVYTGPMGAYEPTPGYPNCLAPGYEVSDEHCPEFISYLRCSEILSIRDTEGVFEAHWENPRLQMATAQYNICLIFLLMLVILIMYTALSGDVSSMVVQPIEAMVGLVKKLSENPNYQLEGQSKSKYETEAVRVALAKIVGLMQLGFGGAGHEIISANLANSESSGLDLMLTGKKKDCAYGFCDIRQFTDTVECLQDQVMLFTNSVGEIVHQSCHDNRGEPNKNIGDAFLIVWRPKSAMDNTKVVDGALTAFRRCVREIASSQTLQLVTNVEAIHKKFGRGKYRTKLGFGLHFGWSVEGPVGTPTKIDCSYLSPEVKISDRLEAATKIYSSNVLMSGQFYDLLSDHIKVGIRLIDHVTLKGGVKPFRIYADDRSNLWLKINPRLVEIYGAEAAYEQFSKTFHEGIDAFIKGDWPTAQQKLEGARDFCPKDTPTLLLMKEMKKRSIDPVTPTAPVDWKGYHDSDV
mmetsp:Transcript_30840/g.80463  ORF Transcript_30840/g.80463 Transcript_30840/m.80463 type:complete len:795 (-) Transcript_30840:473-2857(-)